MEELIIRKITEEDNLPLHRLIKKILEDFGLDIPGTAYFDPQLENLYGYYEQIENGNYWVAEKNGEVVGGIGIAPFNNQEKICELQKLYVSSKVRGNGIGQRLVETALQFAAEHYEQCYLETHHKLVAAAKLYEKVGFTLLEAPLPGSEHSAMDMWYLKSFKE